jgi:hypothetical protein
VVLLLIFSVFSVGCSMTSYDYTDGKRALLYKNFFKEGKHIGHPLLNAPLKKPEKFKVNFSTIYVILMKIMKGVEINA